MRKSDKAAVINAIYFFMGKVAGNKTVLTYDYIYPNNINEFLNTLLCLLPEEFVIMYAKHPSCLKDGVIADIESTILRVIKEYYSNTK